MAVVRELGWPLIQELIDDAEEEVAVQALNMLRNLAHKKAEEIDLVIGAAGGAEQMLGLLTSRLDPATQRSAGVRKEALMAVNNIATGSDAHKELLMGAGVPALLLHYMRDGAEGAVWGRLYATWTVINLTYVENAATAEARALATGRAHRMRVAGLEAQLQEMEDDPSQDVQERVRTALKSMEELLDAHDAMDT
jgi:hypothetical protein